MSQLPTEPASGPLSATPLDPVTDQLLQFLRFIGRAMPISVLLDEAPRRIAAILGVHVASIYLLEGGGQGMVLRGNVGFDPKARGRVRLSVGEGLTGQCLKECRPIRSARASEDANFRGFDELEEEAFPVFLAVPIFGNDRPLGVLVLQRQGVRPFDDLESQLALALTGPISSAIRHTQLLNELRERTNKRATGSGTKKVTLPGEPVVSGRVIGALAALRRPALQRPGGGHKSDGEAIQPATAARRLRSAFDRVDEHLDALVKTGQARGLTPASMAFLDGHKLITQDARLREKADAMIKEGSPIGDALGSIAREATRAASKSGDAFLQQRASDIEELLHAVLMLASPDAPVELPSKALLIGDDITVFDVLISARARPVGVVLTDLGRGPHTKTLLTLMGLPAIVDVAGVFRWASPGDIALLDADHGLLVVNPSRAEIAAVRAVTK